MTDEKFTFCPGCDSRIVPGQDVVGVSEIDGSESGDSTLWHAGCRKTWEYDQRIALAMSSKTEELFEATPVESDYEERNRELHRLARLAGKI